MLLFWFCFGFVVVLWCGLTDAENVRDVMEIKEYLYELITRLLEADPLRGGQHMEVILSELENDEMINNVRMSRSRLIRAIIMCVLTVLTWQFSPSMYVRTALAQALAAVRSGVGEEKYRDVSLS